MTEKKNAILCRLHFYLLAYLPFSSGHLNVKFAGTVRSGIKQQNNLNNSPAQTSTQTLVRVALYYIFDRNQNEAVS